MAEIEQRPIKFRFVSKHKDTGKISIREQTLEDLENEDSWQGFTPWVPLAVCQYTGLDDKNGTPVFEGDIVRNDSWVGAIKYCHSGYDDILAFHPVDKEGHHHNHYYGGWSGNDFEVIGNIHQNGDLLNAKD